MAEVYKELQEQNEADFQDTPSITKQKSSKNGAVQIDPIKKQKALLPYAGGESKVSTDFDLNRSTALSSDFLDTKILGVNIGTPYKNKDVFNPISGFNVVDQDVDLAKVASTGQSNVIKSLNVGTQFIGKTAVNTVGGVVGGFYGIGSAIANKEFRKVYDNKVNTFLDSMSAKIDEANTVNVSREDNFASNLFSFNTIKGIGDAGSFIAGAVASEIIMQTLGNAIGGSGVLTLPGRMAALANRSGRISKLASLGSQVTGKTLRGFKEAAKLTDNYDEFLRLGVNASPEVVEGARRLETLSATLGYKKIQDLRRGMELSNMLKDGANMTMSMVIGTFWEAGLEARQAKESFVNNAMQQKAYELAQNTDLSEDDAKAQLIEYKKEMDEMGNKVGNSTFLVNTAVLQVSNLIQFPTVFNKFSKKLKGASNDLEVRNFSNTAGQDGLFRMPDGSLKAKTLGELGNDGSWLTGKRWKGLYNQGKRITGESWKYAKNPLTEASEEYAQYLASQSSQNYYDNVLHSEYGLNPGVSSSLKNIMASLSESLKDSSKNHAWDEAMIGGIMGALGIPMFKRKANGKTGIGWEGGISGEIKENRARQLQRDKRKVRNSPVGHAP